MKARFLMWLAVPVLAAGLFCFVSCGDDDDDDDDDEVSDDDADDDTEPSADDTAAADDDEGSCENVMDLTGTVESGEALAGSLDFILIIAGQEDPYEMGTLQAQGTSTPFSFTVPRCLGEAFISVYNDLDGDLTQDDGEPYGESESFEIGTEDISDIVVSL